MYDELTGRYGLSCPARGQVRLPLSALRTLERLPGAAHPAVYRVTFACPCGRDHDALLTHEELDWAPLGATETTFFNVMTARFERVASELLDQAARRIEAGAWPWSFFCYLEARPRPIFPSAFRLLTPADRNVGVAVRCPACAATSVNLVSRDHVDVPFYNDPRVGVVRHVFAADHEQALAAFRAELHSGSFDTRRLELEG
jgi:hypothetical protein